MGIWSFYNTHTHKEQNVKSEQMLGLRPWEEKLYYYYALIHIPITVLVDSSVVVPERWQLLPSLVKFHVEQNNDYLLYEKPALLQLFVWLELVVQLPLFFYFAHQFRQLWRLRETKALVGDDKSVSHELVSRSRALRRYLFIYGVNASMTTLWCIYMVCVHGYYPYTRPGSGTDFRVAGSRLSQGDRLSLVLVYLPTFLLPARLMFL